MTDISSKTIFKFAVYSRKSRATGRGESIENQAELCKRYIEANFGVAPDDKSIVAYEDEGFSGKNTNRPAFVKMMNDARKGEITHIVCYRLDRISRNIGDFARLIEELYRIGVAFISIKEQFDTGSPMGRAMMYIASVFSQLERETIAERIRDNMQELAKSGRWLGGITPTGYKSVKVKDYGEKKKVSFRLETDDKEMQCVMTVFDAFEKLQSLTKVEKFLMQNDIRSKNGRNFSRLTIKAILENPVYACADKAIYDYFTEAGAIVCGEKALYDGSCGVMAYNKTRLLSGKTQVASDERLWIIAAGAHKGAVSGSRWLAIRRLLRQKRRGSAASDTLSENCSCNMPASRMESVEYRPHGGRRSSCRNAALPSLRIAYACEVRQRSRCLLLCMHKKERGGRKCCAAENISGKAADAYALHITAAAWRLRYPDVPRR